MRPPVASPPTVSSELLQIAEASPGAAPPPVLASLVRSLFPLEAALNDDLLEELDLLDDATLQGVPG